MDIAIPYKNHFKLNSKVQQFNIKFNPDMNDFDTLIEFIQKFKDKQINIEYRNGIDVKTASALSKVGDNVRFRLRAEDIQKVDKLHDRECKFFFDSSLAATDWMALYRLVNGYGVTDVYISDDLCYEMDKVHEYCDDMGVKVRMILNRAPLTQPVKKDMFIAPLYRPQDMEVLERWIDVAEFDCGNPYTFETLEIMYKVYIKNKSWYGQLGEINPDFADFDMPCPGLTWMLADKRSTCGLRCLKGGSCNTCKLLVTAAQSLRDIGAQLAT